MSVAALVSGTAAGAISWVDRHDLYGGGYSYGLGAGAGAFLGGAGGGYYGGGGGGGVFGGAGGAAGGVGGFIGGGGGGGYGGGGIDGGYGHDYYVSANYCNKNRIQRRSRAEGALMKYVLNCRRTPSISLTTE